MLSKSHTHDISIRQLVSLIIRLSHGSGRISYWSITIILVDEIDGPRHRNTSTHKQNFGQDFSPHFPDLKQTESIYPWQQLYRLMSRSSERYRRYAALHGGNKYEHRQVGWFWQIVSIIVIWNVSARSDYNMIKMHLVSKYVTRGKIVNILTLLSSSIGAPSKHMHIFMFAIVTKIWKEEVWGRIYHCQLSETCAFLSSPSSLKRIRYFELTELFYAAMQLLKSIHFITFEV